ncbi:MAG TPA: hypothetical protein VGO47_15180 [Chlamydiales bacterium]|nr:hypothetical protein [Chlamydiales bacterium]
MEPPAPQSMPLPSMQLPVLRLRPSSPVVQFHAPPPPSVSNHSQKRVSFQQILEFGMVAPASPDILAALPYTRCQCLIDAAQHHKRSLQHRVWELEMAAKTNGTFFPRMLQQRVNGLLPTENRIVDEESKCTYCDEYTPIPLRHFFMHLLTEMCHYAGFPHCAPGRQCILSTREKLIKAFKFWARPTFRCPQCYMECGSSDLVVQHLEYGCKYLWGDLSHIRAWNMERGSFDEELAELFHSLGFTGFS